MINDLASLLSLASITLQDEIYRIIRGQGVLFHDGSTERRIAATQEDFFGNYLEMARRSK